MPQGEDVLYVFWGAKRKGERARLGNTQDGEAVRSCVLGATNLLTASPELKKKAFTDPYCACRVSGVSAGLAAMPTVQSPRLQWGGP